MKKTCCLIALTLLPFLNCSAVRADEGDAHLTALSPNANGLTVSGLTTAALMGHWISDSGTTHYYFGQEQVIIVSLLRLQDNSIAQYKQKLSYDIAAVTGDWMQLEVETPLGWVQTRQLQLADDRQSIVETVQVMGHLFRNRWTYVDDRQQP